MGSIRITIGCMNTKCQHYWEDMCLRTYGEHEIMWISEDGKCDQFQEGKNDLYLEVRNED